MILKGSQSKVVKYSQKVDYLETSHKGEKTITHTDALIISFSFSKYHYQSAADLKRTGIQGYKGHRLTETGQKKTR